MRLPRDWPVAAIAVTCAALVAAVDATILNRAVVLDMVQNNPGDTTVAWQQTKYTDPGYLATLNYTGRVTTGELSPFLTVDFSSLNDGQDYFPAGSPARAWLETMRAGVQANAERAQAAGVDFVPFVDMVVLPAAVVAHYADEIVVDGAIVYNNVTRRLLQAMISETVALYGDLVDGILVRTGETYVFDTPYHTGNSPVASLAANDTAGQQAVWVEFISDLRLWGCVSANWSVFVRAWDSFGGWTGDPAYYLNVTNPVPPHPKLYFSIKHTAGDFFRFMGFNGQLAVGNHAQIVEVELQREYEGKGAYPNYVVPGILYGFGDLGPGGADSRGLVDILNATQIRGLWTWSRGGGWWGPYIHGYETWVDLHVFTLARWWSANYPSAQTQGPSWGRGREVVTEEEAFREFVATRLGWPLSGAEEAAGREAKAAQIRKQVESAGARLRASDSALYGVFRNVALLSQAVVRDGHYCPEGDFANCWSWTRDDRLGGLDQLAPHFAWLADGNASYPTAQRFNDSLGFKATAASTANSLVAQFNSVAPLISDVPLRQFLGTSIAYGAQLFNIVNVAWQVFVLGYKAQNKIPPCSTTALQTAIESYDALWAGYSAFGLANELAPSLYKPYYFNLPGALPQPGMDATVDSFRNATCNW